MNDSIIKTLAVAFSVCLICSLVVSSSAVSLRDLQKENKLKQTEVTSPTFNLLNEYQIEQTQINHYDLFRLKTDEELKDLGLFEDSSNTITLVEWPQLIKEKPRNLIELIFKYENDHEKRSVQVKGLIL